MLSCASRVARRSLQARALSSTYVPRPGAANEHKVTLIEGHGIGPELSQAVQTVFNAARVPVEFEKPAALVDKQGKISDELVQSLRTNGVGMQAGLFQTPVGEGCQSLNVQIRQELDLYASIVNVASLPNHPTRHGPVDITVIRENTEGEYSGLEHQVVPGVVESLKIMSADKISKIARYAFDFAHLNGRKKVHVVHKANIMKKADGLFLKVCKEMAEKYDQIEAEDIIIDNCAMQLVSRPEQFDLMVMPNLYGNIVGNIGAGLVGGPGLLAGANVGEDVAVFEQGVRHVAADIAGKGVANPTGMLLSSCLMLRHMHLNSFADNIERATKAVVGERKTLTPDMGGNASTTEFVQAVVAKLE